MGAKHCVTRATFPLCTSNIATAWLVLALMVIAFRTPKKVAVIIGHPNHAKAAGSAFKCHALRPNVGTPMLPVAQAMSCAIGHHCGKATRCCRHRHRTALVLRAKCAQLCGHKCAGKDLKGGGEEGTIDYESTPAMCALPANAKLPQWLGCGRQAQLTVAAWPSTAAGLRE